jgi:uncharacterized protein (AIM24 family)
MLSRVQRRVWSRHISIAYNPSDASPRTPTTSPSPSTVNAQTSTTRPDPILDIVNAGPGALVLARLPHNAHLYIRPGCTIGHSPHLALTKLVQNSWSILWFIGRPLTGYSFFIHKYSMDQSGKDATLLIAPRKLGDVALITCQKNSELYLTRRASILAYGEGVQTQLVLPKLGLRRGWASRVSGTGSVVLSAYGGLYRIGLEQDEVYNVDPMRIVAWNAVMQETERTETCVPAWLTLKRFNGWNKALEWTFDVSKMMWRVVFGVGEMRTFVGPGDVFIASRVEPSWWTSTSAVRQVDEPGVVARLWSDKQIAVKNTSTLTGGVHVEHRVHVPEPTPMQKRA